MNYLQNIVSDMDDEKCVLILGPDLIDTGDTSFFEQMCEALQADNEFNNLIDLTPQYIFVHEELFQLKPHSLPTALTRFVKNYYRKQNQFDEPFRKIAKLPFNLIISLFPDTRLKRIFEEQNLNFEYSHYPRESNPEPVNKPTKNKPLIYNLLGDLNEDGGILTFDQLFDYLSRIMGKYELPKTLQEVLKKAQTFIFLGVHFERWHVQLLLRIITAKEKREKYTILKKESKNELCTFIASRLELEFIDNEPLSFLNQLYDACISQRLAKSARKIFISYSHKDKDTAGKIAAFLKTKNIDVIIDEQSMPGGQKIETFIEKIKTVDGVLTVVSKNSLLSAWVTKEIITTLRATDKYFLPCCLDDAFLDKNFIKETAEVYVQEKVNEINQQVAQRGLGKTDDLDMERKSWTEYFTSLPDVLQELNKRKCISIKESDFSKGLDSIEEAILSIK
jgi:TIR domain/SIR2-like domain